MHTIGYIDHLLKSALLYKQQFSIERSTKNPKVAVLIPVLNESPDIIQAILSKSKDINYPNFEVYLIDSSTDLELRAAVKKIANELEVNYILRKTLRGYKAGAINDALGYLDKETEYALILDVDHVPKSNFLQDLIPILEKDYNLSFIQTPQFFPNEINDKLALVYSFQQHIFYKHICRGLNANKTAFICGTNVIIRISHLNEVGGMYENCITEDVATSFLLHAKGYDSVYIDKVYAEGMAPPSLSAYFTQQNRWAYGTFQNAKNVLNLLLSSPRSLKTLQWWEYLILHSTWYFLGFAILLWLLYPILIILFNIQPLRSELTMITSVMFVSMIGFQFYTGKKERNFKIKDLLLAQGLFLSLFPIHIKTFFQVLSGKEIGFQVTPKKKTDAIPFIKLLPQFVLLVLLIVSVIVGVNKYLMGNNSLFHVLGWAIYNVIILSFMGYFYLEDVKKEKDR